MILSSFVFVVIGITVFQEQKTEKALEALKNLSSPRALVIRGGEKQRIPGSARAVVSFLQGFVLLIGVILVFVSSLNRGLGEEGARAMAFASIVFGNLSLILINRSWSQTIVGTFRNRNNALVWIFGGALLALGLVLYVPLLRTLFLFNSLQPTVLLICLAAGFVSVAWFELFKFFRKERAARAGQRLTIDHS